MFNREETIFKITECANELHSIGDYDLAKTLLQVIEDLSSTHCLDEPDEAIRLRKILNRQMIKQQAADHLAFCENQT